MSTYIALADVNEQEFQNPQELVSIWGDIREDVEKLGGELLDSYALVGGYDFVVTFEVDEEDAAMQIAMAIERHGLDTQTMRAIPTDRLGELVDDI
ncbi:GYD domain-containing protein [Halorarum salinum]|uniref:GYD domain-containing protein n=1 Tax=Halorarum salinum TaxID=2743089 RepID=A0A7D5QEI6_9EURY|nr:GYD domain-containing protein [Halobaculum salinum]QLG62901.1 GYD domain-containing protein [Halobaculum salinum]